MRRPRVAYWTTFGVREYLCLCSVHSTLAAARRAVRACEKAGGSKHTIYRVQKEKRS